MHIVAQIWCNEVITGKAVIGEIDRKLSERHDALLLGAAVKHNVVVCERIMSFGVFARGAA